MPERISANDVPALIRAHSRVFIQGGIGEPRELIDAVQKANTDYKTVTYTSISIPGINQFNPADFHPGAKFASFFMHNGNKPKLSKPKHTEFYPLHYRDIYRFLEASDAFDVAMVMLSPPDENGNCSLGISVDFVPAILDRAKLIIAEINTAFPASHSSPKIPYASIDYCIHSDHPIPTAENSAPSSTAEKIAEHVSSLVDDGDCLQIGVGKLPGAILGKLVNHRKLGFHSGLLCDEVRTLIEENVITGERKSRDKSKHVTGIVLGGLSLYDWSASHSAILFKPVNYTHDIGTLTELDNFVSINSVLEVDLLGQANAEWIDGDQVSSVGGLVDFVRGARQSKHGRSILALPSTALGGSRSRISTRLNRVSVSRADVDYVVTEYGIAKLSDKSIEQRAAALINIAAPQFRHALEEHAEIGTSLN